MKISLILSMFINLLFFYEKVCIYGDDSVWVFTPILGTIIFVITFIYLVTAEQDRN